jgi:hypothetical protein
VLVCRCVLSSPLFVAELKRLAAADEVEALFLLGTALHEPLRDLSDQRLTVRGAANRCAV